jgi:hypothetical protein
MASVLFAGQHCSGLTVIAIEVISDILHYCWRDNKAVFPVAFNGFVDWPMLGAFKIYVEKGVEKSRKT